MNTLKTNLNVCMNNTSPQVSLHPNLFKTLFAHQHKVSPVFKDVLGLYDIHHIAISHISNNQLLTFSSTPSLEFNLFKSHLWRYDTTYQSNWYRSCTMASWPSLYTAEHYDELYYIKQIKHAFPLGLSFTLQQAEGYTIYSIASNKYGQPTQDLFEHQQDQFYKIGRYCSHLLLPLLKHCEHQRLILS
jgi:hypothetical protein